MSSELTVDVARKGEVTVVSPVGRIDQETAADFQATLMDGIREIIDGDGHMVLNFAGVAFISSLGLRSLMIGAKELRAADRKFLIADLTPIVQEVFQISRFDRVIDVHDTLDDAMVALVS